MKHMLLSKSAWQTFIIWTDRTKHFQFSENLRGPSTSGKFALKKESDSKLWHLILLYGWGVIDIGDKGVDQFYERAGNHL